MQPSAAHGTAFRRSPALCKASGFMIETVQSRRIVGMKISEAIVRSTKSRKLCNIFFGCTAATSSMKQQAPKTLPQKAETIENTRKTADILIGAACHQAEPKKISARKAQKFQLFHPIGTQCVMGGTAGTGKSKTQAHAFEFASCFFT